MITKDFSFIWILDRRQTGLLHHRQNLLTTHINPQKKCDSDIERFPFLPKKAVLNLLPRCTPYDTADFVINMASDDRRKPEITFKEQFRIEDMR